MNITPVHGDVRCMGIYATGKKAGLQCKNSACYHYDNFYLCGVHFRSRCMTLPKPKPQSMKLQKYVEHMNSISSTAQRRRDSGQQGRIVLYQMTLMKPVGIELEYLNVFPNYTHDNRDDGYGCASLSPMNLGPVDHGQPGLPISQNLENFYQGNKYYAGESEEEFQTTRLAFYNDSTPYPCKFSSKDQPLFFVWIDKEGIEHHLDLIASRQFYCTFYERLVRQQPALAKLIDMIKDGINLRICGYDACEIQDVADVETTYLDPQKPFGYECVLGTMFTLPAEQYPWVRHRTFDF